MLGFSPVVYRDPRQRIVLLASRLSVVFALVQRALTQQKLNIATPKSIHVLAASVTIGVVIVASRRWLAGR